MGIRVEFVDELVRRRRDAVHRLQPDVAGGTAIAEESIALPAAKHGAGVKAVRALHSPAHDVIRTGALNAQHRMRIEPQHFVYACGEQYQQMPDPGGEIDAIVIRRVGFDNLRCLTQSTEEMRPRLNETAAT